MVYIGFTLLDSGTKQLNQAKETVAEGLISVCRGRTDMHKFGCD